MDNLRLALGLGTSTLLLWLLRLEEGASSIRVTVRVTVKVIVKVGLRVRVRVRVRIKVRVRGLA
jgi:hypothetical protein